MKDKFNENLREARLRKKLTQQQVADRLGIAKSTYPNGVKSRFSVPKYVPILVIIPIKKSPAERLNKRTTGYLSAGSGGRTRTGVADIRTYRGVVSISVPIWA